jgi:HK97 family phage prohead protease
MDIEHLAGRPEARSVTFTDMDVAKDGRSFRGYAAVYGQEADLGKFIEVMVPPALSQDVVNRSGNLPMLWDHNASLPPLATTGGGSLRVTSDKKGLLVEADIDERHMLGPTIMSMLERGDVKGMSFGFMVDRAKGQNLEQRNGRVYRTIRGLQKLLDVSPTWNPAYVSTSAELRSLRQMAVLIDDPEQPVQAQEWEQDTSGPDVETPEAVVPDTDADVAPEATEAVVPDEQRTGADSDHEVEAEQRMRRLQMLGLSVPR